MNATAVAANPFALMVQPEQVLQAMGRSESLQGLRQQKFSPLDRELPVVAGMSVRAVRSEDDPEPWLRGMTPMQAELYRSLLA